MTSINATNARKKLFSLIKEVNNNHETAYITSENTSAFLTIKNGLSELIGNCSKDFDW